MHVVRWGTYVYTPMIGDAHALVSAETTVANESNADAQVKLMTTIEEAPPAQKWPALPTRRRWSGCGPHVHAADHGG